MDGVGVMKDKDLKLEDVKKDPSHTGWIIIMDTISMNQFRRRSRKTLGGRVV